MARVLLFLKSTGLTLLAMDTDRRHGMPAA